MTNREEENGNLLGRGGRSGAGFGFGFVGVGDVERVLDAVVDEDGGSDSVEDLWNDDESEIMGCQSVEMDDQGRDMKRAKRTRGLEGDDDRGTKRIGRRLTSDFLSG